MRRNKTSTRMFVLLLILGFLVGGVLAEALSDKLEFLKRGISIGFSPVNFDFYFFVFTLGFNLKLNLGSIIGILIVLLFYKI
ncbi:DUF4321 domain-containing protein [Dictyoglomus thermophilum]|uniref:DUF4321 domain-containing protein n=2 Tax=Dictyoglomus thermophilum TaxID=14 RepID=B5YE63_DICT6|nr:DUF4321 domain-containing protein [Dictyoglomus thermophilum]ACI18916.1 hypothetical protein DICTH_0971 [Dictyoglomus thermophilum H-6-12]MCX7720969.1 DUF4321 domain-containing protein [Dictyoglomus thermophilum]TYT22433.1 DUF4321 domain-containing protein [Dictyoglomus thermophilum]